MLFSHPPPFFLFSYMVSLSKQETHFTFILNRKKSFLGAYFKSLAMEKSKKSIHHDGDCGLFGSVVLSRIRLIEKLCLVRLMTFVCCCLTWVVLSKIIDDERYSFPKFKCPFSSLSCDVGGTFVCLFCVYFVVWGFSLRNWGHSTADVAGVWLWI